MEQQLKNLTDEFNGLFRQFLDLKNGLDKRLSENFVSQESFAHLSELVAQLETRVKELEGARIVQRLLNQSFQPKATSTPTLKPATKVSFWDLFKQ